MAEKKEDAAKGPMTIREVMHELLNCDDPDATLHIRVFNGDPQPVTEVSADEDGSVFLVA